MPPPPADDHTQDTSATELTEFGFDSNDDEWLATLRDAEAPPARGRIGQYELVTEVGRGGQGVVFRARQPNTKRDIALKRLIGGSMASSSARARFEREVEAVSVLNHPNIVTVYGLDVVDDQPMLAMEWIDGVPVNRWTQGNGRGPASPRDALAMFLRICDAVQHAHQRGVIHRDLKPNNILVDAEGQPHLLDFGLAKLVQNDEPAATVTHTGQFMGTPAYAAPEQVRGDLKMPDVRTDVYALGVVLYEMLTRKMPYPVSRSFDEMRSAIETSEPSRASSVVSGLDREIDTILQKALNKDPELRYQSVDAFAADIRRYLAGEPILAHPPSTFYQIRKLVGRHRLAFAFAATVSVLLVVIAIGAVFFAAKLAKQRDEAVAARQEAADQRDDAIAARQEESTARATAQQINTFLQDMLASVQPEKVGDRDVTVREILDEAAEEANRELADQPQVLAGVRMTIGDTYRSLGLLAEARPHLEFALEQFRTLHPENHATTVDAKQRYATFLQAAGKYDEAEALFRDVLAFQQANRADQPLAVASAQNNLGGLLHKAGKYDEAEALLRAALATHTAVLESDDPLVTSSMSNLGSLLITTLDLQEAEQLLREAYDRQKENLGDIHYGTLVDLSGLATIYRERGQYDKAEPLLRQVADGFRQILGERHPVTITAYNNLAGVLNENGEVEASLPILEDVLRMRQELHGPSHPDVAVSMNNLAGTVRALGDLERAIALYTEALRIARNEVSDEHPLVASSLNNLAYVCYLRKDLVGAEKYLRESLELRRRVFGPEHPEYAKGLNNLARLLEAKGETEEALRFYAESTDIIRTTVGDDHPSVAIGLFNRGVLLLNLGRADEAEPLLREALALRQENMPPDHWRMAQTESTLGMCLLAQSQFDQAEPLLLESYEKLSAAGPVAEKATQSTAKHIVELYERLDRQEDAARWTATLDALMQPDAPAASQPSK